MKKLVFITEQLGIKVNLLNFEKIQSDLTN